jgi:gas vesicle protein
MYYDEDSGPGGFIAGVAIGAIFGAGLALLLAPDSGRITRARLVSRMHGEDASEDDLQDLDDIEDLDDFDDVEDLGELDRNGIMAVLKQRRRR